MRVKLPSVSKWWRIVLTDDAALNGTRLLLHRHYIMQITTMKEVKSGERQKVTDRWEMWFSPTPICRINHITEGLEHKRTHALWQPWWCFSPLFSLPKSFNLPKITCPVLLLVLSVSSYGVLPLRVWRMRVDSRLPSPCWSSHANYPFGPQWRCQTYRH